MKRSTTIMLAIMLAALGLMLFAAESLLEPLAKDAAIGRKVTAELEDQGFVLLGSRVRLIRRGAGPERLATSGKGIVLDLRPQPEMLARDGGPTAIALRAVAATLEHYPDAGIAWVEVRFLAAEGDDPGAPEVLRTLVEVTPEGRIERPRPELPRRLDALPAQPGAPARSTPPPSPAPPDPGRSAPAEPGRPGEADAAGAGPGNG